MYRPSKAVNPKHYRGRSDMLSPEVKTSEEIGRSSQLSFAQSINAALHRLPLLIICENNKYAAHTPIEKRQAVAKLAERAQAFGIPFEKHDGNDPVLLLETLERVVPEIRAGKGPRCIEIATYRDRKSVV